MKYTSIRRLPQLLAVVIASLLIQSCKDEELSRNGDADLVHIGEEWEISSVSYVLIDQSVSGAINQIFKIGQKENVGSFYFMEDEFAGSFEMNIEGYNKEDVFHYSLQDDNISVFDSEGVKTSINILLLTGRVVSETQRTLTGTITRQGGNGQFILEVDMVLEKR